MEGTFEKRGSRKWRQSLSSFISPHLPALATRIMPPTSPHHDSTARVPVYSISGSGMTPHPTAATKTSGQDQARGRPDFATYTFEGPVCRICHDVKDATGNKKLVSPCGCTGSAQYIHKHCLQKWTRLKGASTCEICHKSYEKKYVKFRMTSSEENTVASAITILLLLLGVLSVGVYLLAEYLIKIRRDPDKRGSTEVWVSVSLVVIGMLGMSVFLPWFICFCMRSGKTPRSMMGGPASGGSSSSMGEDVISTPETSVESSMADLTDPHHHRAYAVESAQLAYEHQRFEASGYADEPHEEVPTTTSDLESPHPQASHSGAYVNKIVQVDGLQEDNVYDKDYPAVLFV